MRLKNDEVEEALDQLEQVDDLQEENQRLNNTLKKLKGKQGEKETNIEELLEVERELQEVTKDFQAQTKEMEKVKTDRDFLENKVEELEKEKKAPIKLLSQITSQEM